MNSADKKPLGKTFAFKATYLLTSLMFLALCLQRMRLILGAASHTGLTLPLLAALAAALVLLWYTMRGRRQSGEFAFYILTVPFYWLYAFAQYTELEKSLIWLLMYAAGAFFVSRALRKECSKKVGVAALGVGLLFAISIFLGHQLKINDRLEILYILSDEPEEVLRLLLGFGAQVMFYTTLLSYVFSYSMETDLSEDVRTDKAFWQILLMTAFILLCWLPYYCSFFPGNLSGDSLYEIEQQLGLTALSNHHPYIHQLLIGLCLKLGGASLQSGVAIYTAVQMLIMALGFALCVHLLGKMGANKTVRCAALAFYALFTVNAFYSVTVWKDVLHGAVTLLLMMLLVLESENKGDKKKKALRLVTTVVVAFLFCTLRNNGWHAFVLGFPLFAVCNRKNWKRLGAVFIAVVLMVCAYNHVIFDVLGVKKSATGEALSVPLQQIARTVKLNPDELDSEDFTVLREVFPDLEALGEKYTSYISDPVKASGVFSSEVFDETPGRYLKAWANIGLKHPVTYVEAFLLQSYGYWYPDVEYWIIHNEIEANDLGLSHSEESFAARHELSMLTWEISKFQPVAIIYSLGLMVWLLIIAAALLCLKGQGRLASPLCIMAAFWLTTLASPVYCEYRYLYGLVVSVPLFVGLALGVKTKTE